jgi:hypothetical protein
MGTAVLKENQMKRKTIGVFAALGLGALTMTPTTASAINSYNSSPAPERTEVGAFMALWDNTGDGVPDRFDWVCSGTMIDADTYLTAAHCTDDWPAGTRFFVSLEQDVQGPLDAAAAAGLTAQQTADQFLADGLAVEATPHQDPAYPGPASDPHDIAVLDFSDRAVTPADVWTFTPAHLPTLNELSNLGPRALDAHDWMVVGYGTQEATRGPGGHTWTGGGARLKAPEDFNAFNKAWVRLSMNESRGNGGACYGDSGGPNFVSIGGTWVLAATTITGDVPCYATNVVYRTDTAESRAFLAPYVALP